MEEPITGEVEHGTIKLPPEALAEAGLSDGDSVYVDVDEDGVVRIERTTVYESSEAFIAHLREEHERLLAGGR